MRKYGIDGGAFWRWVNYTTSEDGDATQGEPIKRRGTGNVYNPVRAALAQLYAQP